MREPLQRVVTVRSVVEAPSKSALLLVEHEHEVTPALDAAFSAAGFTVHTVTDSRDAMRCGLTREYDVIVIDRGLPVVRGLEVLRRLRTKGVHTPSIMITPVDRAVDRVEMLDAGADDCLGRPFEVDELLARVRAVVRRGRARTVSEHELQLGPKLGRLDPVARVVTNADGNETALSERESALLEVLAQRPTRVVSRDELLERVFSDASTTAVVETYVHYLRRKLGTGVIHTVRGVGYRLGTR